MIKMKKKGFTKKGKKACYRTMSGLYLTIGPESIRSDTEKSLKNFGNVLRRGLFSLVERH